MPRSKSHTKDSLVEAAMHTFWHRGFEATSMDDLVKATKVSRHGIYSDVGGKRDLYLAGFELYQRIVVTPALEALGTADAGLDDVAQYFEIQIAAAERIGLPGPGCLVANAMTEIAPHDGDVAIQVVAHNERLTAGFLNALIGTAPELSRRELKALAEFLTVAAQGLWSMSRVVQTAKPLRDYVKTLMGLLKGRLRQ